MPPWRVIVWLLWRAAAGVGLNMKVDGLIVSNGVFIILMRVSMNQDGIPVGDLFLGIPDGVTLLEIPGEVWLLGIPGEVFVLEIPGDVWFLGVPGGVSILEIPGEGWLYGLPDEASTGGPDEVAIWLRAFR